MLTWVSSFMTDRRYRIVRPAVTDYTTFGIGVPQGSSLSPLYFALLIIEISWHSSWDDRTTIDMVNEDLPTMDRRAIRWGMYFVDGTFFPKLRFIFFRRDFRKSFLCDTRADMNCTIFEFEQKKIKETKVREKSQRQVYFFPTR